MKNNKGVTIVELIVSMTLLVVVATFLFQMIITLKEIYNSSGIKTEMLTKQALISKMINDDFNEKGIEMALKCSDSDNCLAFYFKDGTRKTLEFIKKTDNAPAYFIYGDYKTELVNNSDFGAYSIETNTVTSNSGLTNDSVLKIDIPITHPLLKNQEFGVNIVYQYNSKTTSITDLSINGNSSASKIWLAGASDMIWYNTVDFVDPGYYYLDSSNNLVKANDSTDAVLVTRSSIANNVMTVTYQSRDNSAETITRTVNFINTSYDYSYNGSYYVFSAPVNGSYKIETWGANGNSNSTYSGGTGSYNSGLITLNQNEKLYVYVGGTGSGDIGGYNGGGSITTNQSLQDGAPGGGATDIRLKDGNWDSIDGLRSRIMVAAGGGGASSSTCGSQGKIGGNGGTLSSSSFTINSACTDGIWTLALGANQNSGGSLEIYDTTGTKTNTLVAGKFGMASSPTDYSGDIKSGGGGGYYGGASSGYGSPGTGGSSFVSGCTNCMAIKSDGTVSDTNVHFSGKTFTNIVMEDGNSITTSNPDTANNGYAKITLVSVSHNANDISNTKKVTLNIGGDIVSRNITNDITTFDLSSYNISNYNHISCNNDANPTINGNLVTISGVYSDIECVVADDLIATISSTSYNTKNIVMISDTIVENYVASSGNIKLDINGKNITINKQISVTSNFEVNDTLNSGKVIAKNGDSAFNLGSQGSLKLNSINIEQDFENVATGKNGVWISSACNGCEVIINNSNINVGGAVVGIHGKASNSNATINNGNYISMLSNAISLGGNGENNNVVNILDGNYTSYGEYAVIYNYSANSVVNIKNGTFTQKDSFTVILNYGSGNINICGGNMSGTIDLTQNTSYTGFINYHDSGINWSGGSAPITSGNSTSFVVNNNITCD